MESNQSTATTTDATTKNSTFPLNQRPIPIQYY